MKHRTRYILAFLITLVIGILFGYAYWSSLAPFDPQGGEGYDGRKAVHPDCPECFGEGIAIPFPKDTRHLSEGARRLYAGVKVTGGGIEIKMHDQVAALLNVAKHLGMFVTKHEHGGSADGPIPISIIRFN